MAHDPVASRDELMESRMADHVMSGHEQRTRLLMSTERLNQSGEKIKESKRTLLGTEELEFQFSKIFIHSGKHYFMLITM
ncbi:hypothetical protein CY35_12G068100 [Sphagnum magellanicum]|nr:hypothetical protein CY35_12G068100 [Sphagnum magellanicum]